MQWLGQNRATSRWFPAVLNVLEDTRDLVKVEQDCGRVLIDLVMDTDAQIPENWVVHIMKELVDGTHALHSAGFLHLDLSLENTMVNLQTGTLCGRPGVCAWESASSRLLRIHVHQLGPRSDAEKVLCEKQRESERVCVCDRGTETARGLSGDKQHNLTGHTRTSQTGHDSNTTDRRDNRTAGKR